MDAAIAGCLVQAVVQQEMTNHAGTVTCLYYEAATGKLYQFNAMGPLVPGLAPVRPVPPGSGLYASLPESLPCAAIPGFMPGMKPLHERFASKPWAELCRPAITWADKGHIVNTFEFQVLADTAAFSICTASGRAHFLRDGHLPQVGDRWPQPVLAETMRHLADEGPDYFITGKWAEKFVSLGNELGRKITLEHMTAIPPRWQEPLPFPSRLRHRATGAP